MLKLNELFQDHMVLQRGKEIPVWGTAEPGSLITVAAQGITAEAVAGENGAFCVRLPALTASFNETITVTARRSDEPAGSSVTAGETGSETACGVQRIELSDVLIGDVWLLGGQSNMEFHMRYDADYPAEKEICSNDHIRFLDYPEVAYVGQIDEKDYRKEYLRWRKAAPQELERFSAVGYYFAKELQKKYDVPIGLIGCNWGGTPACAWMSKEAIVNGGGQIFLDEYDEAVKALDLAAYDAAYAANPANFRTDQLADPISDMMMFGCTMAEFAAKLAEMGVDLSDPAVQAAMQPQMGPKYERRPSGLYESMLQQIAPFGLKGFLYYQGETDGDTHPECYKTLFPALIADWRKLWNEELPFFFVQIAPLEQWMQCIGEPYAIIRAAQQFTADTVPGTGMAVTSDVGMQWDIHPKKKQPVGQRLALLAENLVYHDDAACEAPTLTGAEVSDGRIVLQFENAGDGLYLADVTPYKDPVSGERLGGVRILQEAAENASEWKELDAEHLTAAAEGSTVILTGEEIRSAATKVLFAQGGWYQVNLYNSAGLPARPALWP